MKIEIGINPNCSEATIRIDVRGQDKKLVKKLITKLETELHETYGTKVAIKSQDWDNDEDATKLKEFDWSEGYVTMERIFGIDCIKINGDAPYNFGEEIETVVRRYLPNADLEWCEP